MPMWSSGRTLASHAGRAGSTPVMGSNGVSHPGVYRVSKQLAAMSRIWRDRLIGKTVETMQVRSLLFPSMRRCRQMKEQNPFYKTRAWKRKRAAILRRDGYQCQECRRYGRTTQAVTVHHIKELEEYPELALADDNLVSLCAQCHNKAHPEKAGSRRRYGS